MPIERLRPSFFFNEERIKDLKRIAPEAFADGKINWEILKEALGQFNEDETGEIEHFGLFWPGKKEARKIAAIPSKGTLVPVFGEGLKPDGKPDIDGTNDSQNIFIEGENLEVLKILQKSYAGRIKMIYIDPPYNTGNDFVYDDNFTEPLQEYLKRSGQIDEEGNPLTTNKKADGRFHSKWLNMMYPRLILARNLLMTNGLIFVSIDENEINNLKLLLNEIFGEENFIDTIIWKKRYGGGPKEKYLVTLHEYILVYAKDIIEIEDIFIPLTEESIKRYYKLKDDNFAIRGPYRTHPLEATKSVGRRENLVFGITAPDGTIVFPSRQWWWDQDRVNDSITKGELEFTKSKDGKWSIHSKQYLKDEDGQIRKTKPFSIIDSIYTQHGTDEIEEIFGDSRYFNFPKPTELILQLIDIANLKDDDIILDFFSGICPTAHALWKKSARDDSKNRFIMVQMPEEIAESELAFEKGFRRISDLSTERLKLVSPKFSNNKRDVGFKTFKLFKSNFKRWTEFNGNDLTKLQSLFEQYTDNLVHGWNPKELIIEIILIEGFPLDSITTHLDYLKNNLVYKINSHEVDHSLLVCLDQSITSDTIRHMGFDNSAIFICLDSAITDQDKIWLSDKGLIKTI